MNRHASLSTRTLERKIELKTSIYMMIKGETTRREIESMQLEIERRNTLSWWQNIRECIRYGRFGA